MTDDSLTRFHLSLNVADLNASVAFYRTLLGSEPAKMRADYAKFEIDAPPLVLSLEPASHTGGGPLNHAGFRLPDSAALVETQRRLEAAGFRCNREEGVECCYAKQTKFWLHDPDGTLWEIYTLDNDIEHRGIGQRQEQVKPQAPHTPVSASRTEWEHRMNEAVPDHLPFGAETVDEIRLRGTFNLILPKESRMRFLAEVVRVLKPGGRLFVHVLTGDSLLTKPDLPGPASMVRHVPQESEPIHWLETAGLGSARILKLDPKPCFTRQGVSMRETQLEAWKPHEGSDRAVSAEVLYRGPFDSIDDGGRTFPRGVRVKVPAAVAQRFHTPEWSAQFTVFEIAESCRSLPGAEASSCTSAT